MVMSDIKNDAADPWVVKASGGEPLPPGVYTAKFLSVENFENLEKGITGKWKWSYEIASGVHKGKIASALTDQSISPNTHSGRLVAGMNGKAIAPGDNVKAMVDSAVGKTYMIRQSAGPKGGKPSVQSADVMPG